MTSDKRACDEQEQHGGCSGCRDVEPSFWCPTCNRAVADKRCPLCGLKARKVRPDGTLGKLVVATLLLAGLLSPALLQAESYYWADREGFHSVDSLVKVPRDRRCVLPMARNRTALPFTEEEDRDGAMYAWFILGQAGIRYPYTGANDLPHSDLFAMVAVPQDGDIAWWPGYVAIFRERERTLLSARGEEQLAAVEERRGKAVWYRYDSPAGGKETAARRAPQKVLKVADRDLAGLDDASTFPPRATGDAALERLRGKWRRVEKSLERLRRQYPDDPRVLRRLGECFRLGHNLSVPGASERAEAYLLRAEELGPDDAETYISLGALYADSSMENGSLAEIRFRRALKLAGKERLPQVWWGLAVSLYYQGRRAEALEAIDRVIALQPRDSSARKLKETILESGKKKDG